MKPESIKEMVDYTYWSFDLIWPSIDTPEQDFIFYLWEKQKG